LSWNAFAKSPAAVRPAASELGKSLRRHQSHGDGSHHLNCVRRSGLPKLPARLLSALFFAPNFGGILILAIQPHLLESPAPASLAISGWAS
jgi:hypothetical protein